MPKKPRTRRARTSIEDSIRRYEDYEGHRGHGNHTDHDDRGLDPLMMPAIDSAKSGIGILEIAKVHIGEPYIFGTRAPMSNAAWRGPWDCAEFASWCVYRVTGILFGVDPRNDPVKANAFTGYWGNQARQAGAVISIEDAARIAGSCVLRMPQSGRGGHIVLSDGKGGTVEAHSKEKGVVEYTLSGRRWDMGILVPGVRYFTEDTPVIIEQPREVWRYTDPMMRGKRVESLQVCLAKLEYSVGNADGVYGPQTEAAVQAFQADHELVPDGEVGKLTQAALDKLCKGK